MSAAAGHSDSDSDSDSDSGAVSDTELLHLAWSSQHAASYRGNRHNLETHWKAVYEALGRRVVKSLPLHAVVDSEHDLYFRWLRAFLPEPVSPDHTLDWEAYTILACRPDLVLGYWSLQKNDQGVEVKVFVVVIIIELKRAASRSIVDASTGTPYNTSGAKAIRSHILEAQRQGARQASIYLRTRAARGQKYVWVLAGSGPLAALACAMRGSRSLRGKTEGELLAELSAERRRDDESEKVNIHLPDRPRRIARSQISIPEPHVDGGGLKWRGTYDVRRSQFGGTLTYLMEEFRRDHPELTRLTVTSPRQLLGLESYI